jgi:hypothetical protein
MAASALPGRVTAQDARFGYLAIRNSIVKIWVLDAHGTPISSGSGFIVDSGAASSHIITAAHVIKGGVKFLVDLSVENHDTPAAVVSSSAPRDVALLRIGLGNLQPVKFALGTVMIGSGLAAAGFYRLDQVASQSARLLYPSTVSAVTDEGRIFAFDNVNVREGLSGGPVFDSATGAVIGMITSRSVDSSGGYAISGPMVLYYYLSDQGVNVAVETSGTIVPGGTAPPPATVATTVVAPPMPQPVPVVATPVPPAVLAKAGSFDSAPTAQVDQPLPDVLANALSGTYEFDAIGPNVSSGGDGRTISAVSSSPLAGTVHFRISVSVSFSGCHFDALQSIKFVGHSGGNFSVDDAWTGDLGEVASDSVVAARLAAIPMNNIFSNGNLVSEIEYPFQNSRFR